jgi:hypothetical protein
MTRRGEQDGDDSRPSAGMDERQGRELSDDELESVAGGVDHSGAFSFLGQMRYE